MAEGGQPTGTIQIGLDASQFKAGTQAILSDIRSIMQGLAQFERVSSKAGGSLKGFEDASRSLRAFRSVIDGDAVPALRRLQSQAKASANSLSRVFQVGAQSNQAVSGINRVTTALAAQERQALRTAEAMARAATAGQRGAMAFRNGGRAGTGSFSRSVAGGSRGARSSLDDSGAAAQRLIKQTEALFSRVGKLTTGKSYNALAALNSPYFAKRGSLAPKLPKETRAKLREADQARALRSRMASAGIVDINAIGGTATLQEAAKLYARALARSTAAGVRIRSVSPRSQSGRRIASTSASSFETMMDAIFSTPSKRRPRAFIRGRQGRRETLLSGALQEMESSAGIVASSGSGSGLGLYERLNLKSGYVADMPNPYRRRSSIPELRRLSRIIVGAYSANAAMVPGETGYIGALSGVGAPGVGASMIAREIKRRGRSGRSLPLTAVADALPLYLRGAFGQGPSGRRRVSASEAQRRVDLGQLTSLGMSGEDARTLTKMIRAALPAEEDALGLPRGSVKYAKKGKLSDSIIAMQRKHHEKRTHQAISDDPFFEFSSGTASPARAGAALARSVVRAKAAGIRTREFGNRGFRRNTPMSPFSPTAREIATLNTYKTYFANLMDYTRGQLQKPGGRDYYTPRPIPGISIGEGTRNGAGMAHSALRYMKSGNSPGRVALAPNPIYRNKAYPKALTRLKYIPVGAYASSNRYGEHGYIGSILGTADPLRPGLAPISGVGGLMVAEELRRRERFTRLRTPGRFAALRAGFEPDPGLGTLEMFGITSALPVYQRWGAQEKQPDSETFANYRKGQKFHYQSGDLGWSPLHGQQIVRATRRSIPRQIAKLRAIPGGEVFPSSVRFAAKGSLSEQIGAAEIRRQAAVEAGNNRGDVLPTASLEEAAMRLARSIVLSQISGVRIDRAPGTSRLREGFSAGHAHEMLRDLQTRHVSGQSKFGFMEGRDNMQRMFMLQAALRDLRAGSPGFMATTTRHGLTASEGGMFPYIPVGAYSTRDPARHVYGGHLASLAGLGTPGVGGALMAAEIKWRAAEGKKAAGITARERFLDIASIDEERRRLAPGLTPNIHVTSAESAKGFYSGLGFVDALSGEPIRGGARSSVPMKMMLPGQSVAALVPMIRQYISDLERGYNLAPGTIRFAKRGSLGDIAASSGMRGKGGDSTVGATSRRGFEPLTAAIDSALGTYISDMLQGLKAGRNGTVGPRQVARALGKFQEDILGSFGMGTGKGITQLRTGFDALPADSRRRISKGVNELFGNLLADYTERMAPALRRGGKAIAPLGGISHAEDISRILRGSQVALSEQVALAQAAFVPQRSRSGFQISVPPATRFQTTPPGVGLEFVNGIPVRNNSAFQSPEIMRSLSTRGQGGFNQSLTALMLAQQFMPRLEKHQGSLFFQDLQGIFGAAGMGKSKNIRGKGASSQFTGGFGEIVFDPSGMKLGSTITLFNTVKTMLHEIEHVREEQARMQSSKIAGASSGPVFEREMKKRGFGTSDLLPVYDPGTGEYMYIPKGSAGKISVGKGSLTLPQGSISLGQYKEMPIAQRKNFERATITQAQAAIFDENAGGSHANIRRHFVPQAVMGMESGYGLAQMASLLAFSNRPILPGETREAADLRSRITNTGFHRSEADLAVLAKGGISAIRPGLVGTANAFIAGGLPAYEQVVGKNSAVASAATFAARVQAGIASSVASMEDGADDVSLIGQAARSLVKATQAIPAQDLQKTFGSLSSTALADFGLILDAAVGSKRALTRAMPLGKPVSDDPLRMEYENPGYTPTRRRRRQGGVPAAPIDVAGRTVRALTPEGLQALSALTHALTLSTAGVSRAALPQARMNVRQGRIGALGLPERISASSEPVRSSYALSTIASEIAAMPEGPHREALKGMLAQYMPNHPLFDLPRGTRTGRGRRAGVATPSTSGGTSVVPYEGPGTLQGSLQRVQDAIFASNMRGGFGPRAQAPGANILPDAEAFKLHGITPSLRETVGQVKDYVANTRVAKGLTGEWELALAKAANGSIQFGSAMARVSDSSQGLLFTIKDTIKFATAITLTQNAAAGISQAIGHLSGGFIEFNSILEQSRVGFTTLFKQGGDAMGIAESRSAAMIERMKEFANVTPFRFPQLEEAAIRMKAFGLELGNIIRRDPETGQLVGYMRSIGDAVAALGGGDERILRITYALGQMNSAGRVYQNDMMQLANAGIAGYEILAEKLIAELEAKGEDMTAEDKKILNDMYGNRIEAIRRLTSKGSISGKGAVQAIMAGLGERYGGGMERLSKTMMGAFSTIADMSQSLVATMTGPLYNAIRDIVVQLATYLQSSQVLAYFINLRDGMVGFANDIRAAIPAAAKIAGDSLTYLFGLFGKIFGGSGSINTGIDTLKLGLRTLADLLSNDVVKAMVLSAIAAKALMSAITSNPLITMVAAIITGLGVMRQAYEMNFMGIKDAIDSVAPVLGEFAETIATSIVPALKGFIEGASVFLTGAFSAAIKVLSPLVSALANSFGGIAKVLEIFSPILGFVIAAIVTKGVVINGFALAFTKLGGAISGAAGAMAQFALQSKYLGSRSAAGISYGMMAVDPRTGMPAAGGQGVVSGEPKQTMRTPGVLRGVTYASAYGPVPLAGGSVTRDADGNVIAREMGHGVTERTTLGRTIDPSVLMSPELRNVKNLREAMIKAGLVGIMPTEDDISREGGLLAARRAGMGEIQVRGKGTKEIIKSARSARKAFAAASGMSVKALTQQIANVFASGDREQIAAIPRELLMPDQMSSTERVARLEGLFRDKQTAQPQTVREYIQAARSRRGLSTDVSPVGNVKGGIRATLGATFEGVRNYVSEQRLMGNAPMTQLAQQAGGLATAFGATTMALGALAGVINTDLGATISQVGITVLSFGQIVSMASTAMAALGGAAGIKSMLSGLASFISGPMGIAAVMAATVGIFLLNNSRIEAALKATSETFKKFNDSARAVTFDVSQRVGWKQTKLAPGGGGYFKVMGQTEDVVSLDREITQTQMEELVAKGLMEKVDNPIIGSGLGDFSYRPTAAGYKAGYVGAEAQSNVAYLTPPAMIDEDSPAFAEYLRLSESLMSNYTEEQKKQFAALFKSGQFDPEAMMAEMNAAEDRIISSNPMLPGPAILKLIEDEQNRIKLQYLEPANLTPDQILGKFGFGSSARLGDYGTPGLIDESIFDVSEKIKLLNENLEDAQKAADEAAKRLQELFDPFATMFEQFMTRAMKIVAEVFQDEQEQLTAETKDALANVTALHNGEEVRLGVLEEQYAVLKEQRAEQERLNALQDAQENAARAALGLFDAQVDPIDAAIAAREASKRLQKEEQDAAFETLGIDIERAKQSTEYAKMEEYYGQRKRQLDEDQEERQRQIQERAQQLLKDIQEGKIKPGAARREFFNMFGDYGIDMESIIETGTMGGEALAVTFGTTFAEKFATLAETIIKTIGDVVRAGVAAASTSANVEDIIADLEKLEKAEDKIRGDKIVKERNRLKEVARQSKAYLAIKAQEYLLAGDDEMYQKSQAYAQNIDRVIQALDVMSIDPNKIYTRNEFNDAFENVYKAFTAMYDDLGAFRSVLTIPKERGVAQGGPIGTGQYIVGERGPEILQLGANGGGYVIPNHKLPRSMRSSAGALKAGRGGAGRAAGGYFGPDRGGWEDAAYEQFRQSMAFIGRPDAFQQYSFNQFMGDPRNTAKMKMELARRFPQNFRSYLTAKLGGIGMARDAGGPVDPPISTPPWRDDYDRYPDNTYTYPSWNLPSLPLEIPYLLDKRATGLGNVQMYGNSIRTMSPYMANMTHGVVQGGTGWNYLGSRPLAHLKAGQIGTWKNSPTGKIGPLMSVPERGLYNVMSKGSGIASAAFAAADILSANQRGEPVGRAVMRNLFSIAATVMAGLAMAGSGLASVATGGMAIPSLIASIAAASVAGTAGDAAGGALYDLMDMAFGSKPNIKPFREIISRPGFPGLWEHTKGQYGKDIFKPYTPPVAGKTMMQARAFGGKVDAMVPYLVGERGPELMVPRTSGYVLPNTGLRAMQGPGDLRSAGGGTTINASVTINNPVVSTAADIDKLAEKVSAAQVRTLRAAGMMRPS